MPPDAARCRFSLAAAAARHAAACRCCLIMLPLLLMPAAAIFDFRYIFRRFLYFALILPFSRFATLFRFSDSRIFQPLSPLIMPLSMPLPLRYALSRQLFYAAYFTR